MLQLKQKKNGMWKRMEWTENEEEEKKRRTRVANEKNTDPIKMLIQIIQTYLLFIIISKRPYNMAMYGIQTKN